MCECIWYAWFDNNHSALLLVIILRQPDLVTSSDYGEWEVDSIKQEYKNGSHELASVIHLLCLDLHRLVCTRYVFIVSVSVSLSLSLFPHGVSEDRLFVCIACQSSMFSSPASVSWWSTRHTRFAFVHACVCMIWVSSLKFKTRKRIARLKRVCSDQFFLSFFHSRLSSCLGACTDSLGLLSFFLSLSLCVVLSMREESTHFHWEQYWERVAHSDSGKKDLGPHVVSLSLSLFLSLLSRSSHH